jgi:hypothetical protein
MDADSASPEGLAILRSAFENSTQADIDGAHGHFADGPSRSVVGTDESAVEERMLVTPSTALEDVHGSSPGQLDRTGGSYLALLKPELDRSLKFDQFSVHSKSEEAPRPIVDSRFTAISQEGGDSAPAQPTEFPEYALQIVQTYLALRAGKEVEIVLAAPFTQYREAVLQHHLQILLQNPTLSTAYLLDRL